MIKIGKGKQESLVQIAHEQLEKRFVTLELQPGSVWSEIELSKLLGIGRTPVREALQRMAADQLIMVIKRAGVMISKISIQEQLFVLETRHELERLVSVRAAMRALDSERAQLHQVADAIEAAGKQGDVLAYLQFHFETKRFVAECARNPYAARALHPLHTLSERFYFMYYRNFDNLELVGHAHAELTRAIANGDKAGAERGSTVVNNLAEDFTRMLLMGHA